MTGRKKFVLSLIMIFIFFVLFILSQIYYSFSHQSNRTAASLLNQYYRLKKTNPEGAKRALTLILTEDPKNEDAIRELGYWYLAQGNIHEALKQFNKGHKLYPNNQSINNELKKLNNLLGIAVIPEKSSMTIGIATTDTRFHLPAVNFNLPVSSIPETSPFLSGHKIFKHHELIASLNNNNIQSQGTMSERDKLLNEFYDNRVKNKELAWAALKELLDKYLTDLIALKEAAYFTLNEGEKELSAQYFERAYVISQDPFLALQLGYIYDGLNKKMLAYHYFDLATKATDVNERMKAELAKTNLRGYQLRILPDPLYTTVLAYPFYQSRFKLLIYPIIIHVGVMLNKDYNFSVYFSYRRTKDNKSSTTNQLPQIYEDDAMIMALGLQGTPFRKIPLILFGEAGKAQDLVYKNRGRWRGDFRGGLVYYDEWGKQARYTMSPRIPLAFNADLYSDLIYFTRYQNTIGTLRARPGIEIFRYGSMALNFYVKAFLSQDTQRAFYNNILEVGPSLAFTPSDRYNFTIRYECLHGYYLPASNSPVNPYSAQYHNNMIFLDTYLGL